MNLMDYTFELIGFLNPSDFYPAEVIPVFREISVRTGNPKWYIQEHGMEFTIQSFTPLPEQIYSKVSRVFGDRVRTRIKSPVVYGFRFSFEDWVFKIGQDEYNAFLTTLITTSRRKLFKFPIVGLEIARYLGDEKAEVIFASLSSKMILSKSLSAAIGWSKYAPISPLAQKRVEHNIAKKTALNLEVSDNQIPAKVFQTHSFNSLHRVRTPAHIIEEVLSFSSIMEQAKLNSNSYVFLIRKEFPSVRREDLKDAISYGVKFVVACEPWFVSDFMNVSMKGIIVWRGDDPKSISQAFSYLISKI